jgi:hypothetical protein
LGNGSVSLEISQTSTAHYSLGFYYEFGSLSNLLQHPIAIVGTGFRVDLWIALGNWTWTPSGSGERFTGMFGHSGNIGRGTQSGTQVTSASSGFVFEHISSCAPGTYTIAQVIGGACSPPSGVNGNSSFALWIGISSDSPGTTRAIVNTISSPYP